MDGIDRKTKANTVGGWAATQRTTPRCVHTPQTHAAAHTDGISYPEIEMNWKFTSLFYQKQLLKSQTNPIASCLIIIC